MSTSATDPGELFGGTWQRIEGRFLLGADSGHTAGSTGGEEEHTLTVGEMPSHSHNVSNKTAYDTGGNGSRVVTSSSYADYQVAISTLPVGGGSAHNNMPPYLAVYIWKRTA